MPINYDVDYPKLQQKFFDAQRRVEQLQAESNTGWNGWADCHRKAVDRIEELEAEVERLRKEYDVNINNLLDRIDELESVIYRNADPCAADKEDAAIIEAICRRITP